MEFLTLALSKFASGVGPFFILLGLLIFVHELGHFLVAVYFGVRVETFSLGFGKKIFSYKKGDTTYCISIIPLGGYVKMYGDDPSMEVPVDQRRYAFLHKPVWPRIAIVLAGPLMNLFFAVFVFAIVGMIGERVSGTQLGDIEEKTKAHLAGFRSGDLITHVSGSQVTAWAQIRELVENHANQSLSFTVEREGTHKSETLVVTPDLGKNPFLFTTKREVGKIEGLQISSAAASVGVLSPTSLAAKSGILTFDIIDSIDGTEVANYRSLESLLRKTLSENKDLVFGVHATDKNNKPLPAREIKISSKSLSSTRAILPQLGLTRSDLYLWDIRPKSPAERAGMMAGDLVIRLNGEKVVSWQTVLDRVKAFQPSEKSLEFTVQRAGKLLTFHIVPEEVELPTEQGAMEKRYAIGVMPAIVTVSNNSVLQKTTNPLRAFAYGISNAWISTKLISMSLVRLIQNEVSARNIGGIISIGRVASKSYEVGLVAFLKMMAVISINLFLLNLLPVPVLDGGHLVFFTLEALRGAPISFKKLEIAQQVGLALLLALMLFALFNDITQLISSW